VFQNDSTFTFFAKFIVVQEFRRFKPRPQNLPYYFPAAARAAARASDLMYAVAMMLAVMFVDVPLLATAQAGGLANAFT
jgi:hypothetical protein